MNPVHFLLAFAAIPVVLIASYLVFKKRSVQAEVVHKSEDSLALTKKHADDLHAVALSHFGTIGKEFDTSLYNLRIQIQHWQKVAEAGSSKRCTVNSFNRVTSQITTRVEKEMRKAINCLQSYLENYRPVGESSSERKYLSMAALKQIRLEQEELFRAKRKQG